MNLTYAEKLHPKHRKYWLIHDGQFLFAEFDDEDQLKIFAEKLGFTYSLTNEDPKHPDFGLYRTYELSVEIVDTKYHFWSLDELPAGAKPIWALSNGSVVECYFCNIEGKIMWYRPNPNAKEVYKPMSHNQQMGYHMCNGIF